MAPARAENGCPYGLTPMPQQYTDPASGTLQMQMTCVPGGSEGGPPGPPPPPPPVWQFSKSFGALAYDRANARWAMSNNYSSKSAVKAGVLAYCQKEPGADCALMLTYSNQCAAVARAIDDGMYVPGKDSVNTGSSQQEAEQNALNACRGDWRTPSCAVILSECSHHSVELIQ
ncbi:MAG: DUF4189 domain-containing protein [Porphyrobacter sp.]|nr:DUF4189 domain-containing protein [Porphyrobacter sp.]